MKNNINLKFFLLNFIIFSLFSFISFSINADSLFSQQDGNHWKLLANLQYSFSSFEIGFSSQILQSLNNIKFPVNFYLIPEFFIPALSNNLKIQPIYSYTLLSLSMFSVNYYTAITFGFRISVAVISSWLLLLTIAPFIREGLVYPMFAIGPPFAWNLTMTLLLTTFFWKIGKNANIFIFELIIYIFLFFWVSLAVSGMVGIIYPIIFLFGLVSLIKSSNNKQELINKLIIFLIIIFLFFFFNFFDFFKGLFTHTASYNYGSELTLPFPPKSLDQASILYHGVSFSYVGPIIFCLGMAGGFLNFFSKKKSKNLLGKLVFFLGITFAIGGAILIIKTSYMYISPVYYDYVMIPFYCILATDFVIFIFRKFYKKKSLYKIIFLAKFLSNKKLIRIVLFFILILFFLILFSIVISFKHTMNYISPPIKTPIVEKLEKEIGLFNNNNYRGRVFTAYKVKDVLSQDWMKISSAGDVFWRHFGNDHHFAGLWWYNIPTLFEYNWLVSPFFFQITRDFLARPEDIQMRNFSTLRKINLRILKLFGVNYIITDDEILFLNEAIIKQKIDGTYKTLYLYYLNDVNIGNYSPTRFIGNGDYISTFRLINSKLDLSEYATLEKVPKEKLVKASKVNLNVKKDTITVNAFSTKKSLIILPFEFSNCLKFNNKNKNNEIKLLRVNSLLTGIIFEKELEGDLKYFTGPFENFNCRNLDKKDFNRLNKNFVYDKK